jgi:hypothetical protein
MVVWAAASLFGCPISGGDLKGGNWIEAEYRGQCVPRQMLGTTFNDHHAERGDCVADKLGLT